MGISGHILGPRKLRRACSITGLPLSRAYRRGHDCEGVLWLKDGCEHYGFDWETGDYELIRDPLHWTSCDPSKRGLTSD